MRSQGVSLALVGISKSSRPPYYRSSYTTNSWQAYSSSTSSYSQSGQFSRSDFGNQPFTGSYEPDGRIRGSLGDTSSFGVPKITPRQLKEHLDQFVIGQDRAKKVLSTAVYNHYQRIAELKRQQDDYERLVEKRARIENSTRRSVQDEYLNQSTSGLSGSGSAPDSSSGSGSGSGSGFGSATHDPLRAPRPQVQMSMAKQPVATLEKANILLLGPTGVGKTLMVKTLANMLDVPFSMSDCTPLSQAGYIGEDAEVVIQRLLAVANYDITRAESGIICLDEIDKIATAKLSHGKDVSGEGVQQSLLKIIEGTTVNVQSKNEKISPATNRERGGGDEIPSSLSPSHSHQSSTASPSHTSIPVGQASATKNGVYTVKTDNILFICTGAFIGLHKLVMERIAKTSIGFGAPVRAVNPESSSSQDMHDTTIKIDSSNVNLFAQHIPFWPCTSFQSTSTPYAHPSNPPLAQSSTDADPDLDPSRLNTLDLVAPSDLQKFGLIPELIGRMPVHCAVSPLSESALIRILKEPRNALIKQYTQLFALSNIDLRFTTSAVHAIAKRAIKLGTGARGLRSVLEAVLGESMYETPGSMTKYVLITSDVVHRLVAPIHLSRGQRQLFENLLAQEEDKDNKSDVSTFEYQITESATGS